MEASSLSLHLSVSVVSFSFFFFFSVLLASTIGHDLISAQSIRRALSCRTECLCLSHAVIPCRLDIRRKPFHLLPRFPLLYFRILLHDGVLLFRIINLLLLLRR